MIDVNLDVLSLIEEGEQNCSDKFKEIEQTAFKNQKKVLDAFTTCGVSTRHFAGTCGYGDDDIGKFKIAELYSQIFHTENAIVSPYLASGTAAISHTLLGILRPNDTILSISGMPYDTLKKLIFGEEGNDIGSLKDYNIHYEQVNLLEDYNVYGNTELDDEGNFCIKEVKSLFNEDKIIERIKEISPKVVYIQRSRGYSFRNALSIDSMKHIFSKIKEISNAYIIVDNCYGEFVEENEPTDVGADLVIGSMIKNIGAGIVPTGGYVAGKDELIKKIYYRLISPALGDEVGSYEPGYKQYFQGLFMSPHIVSQTKKLQVVTSEVLTKLGYECIPKNDDVLSDIVCSIKFNDKEKMIKFCRGFQEASPIDSNLYLEASDMAGYADKIIMASGSFNQGSSIELSADGPVRPPYIVYVQGGLTYEHAKLGLMNAISKIIKED